MLGVAMVSKHFCTKSCTISVRNHAQPPQATSTTTAAARVRAGQATGSIPPPAQGMLESRSRLNPDPRVFLEPVFPDSGFIVQIVLIFERVLSWIWCEIED